MITHNKKPKNLSKIVEIIKKIEGIIKKLIIIFSVLFILVFLVGLVGVGLFIASHHFPILAGGKIAPGITKAKILSLKLGMDKEDVIMILGNPIKIIETDNSDNFTLLYATSGFLDQGFEINLYILGNKLYRTWIKLGGAGVYFCDPEMCIGVNNPSDFEKLVSLSPK